MACLVSIGTGLVDTAAGKSGSGQPGKWDDHVHILKNIVEQAVAVYDAERRVDLRCRERGIRYFRFDTPIDFAVVLSETDPAILDALLRKTDGYLASASVAKQLREVAELTTRAGTLLRSNCRETPC